MPARLLTAPSNFVLSCLRKSRFFITIQSLWINIKIGFWRRNDTRHWCKSEWRVWRGVVFLLQGITILLYTFPLLPRNWKVKILCNIYLFCKNNELAQATAQHAELYGGAAWHRGTRIKSYNSQLGGLLEMYRSWLDIVNEVCMNGKQKIKQWMTMKLEWWWCLERGDEDKTVCDPIQCFSIVLISVINFLS